MRSRFAATAACVAAMLFTHSASAADRLTLDDAFARVGQAHPDLRLAGGPRNGVAMSSAAAVVSNAAAAMSRRRRLRRPNATHYANVSPATPAGRRKRLTI